MCFEQWLAMHMEANGSEVTMRDAREREEELPTRRWLGWNKIFPRKMEWC